MRNHAGHEFDVGVAVSETARDPAASGERLESGPSAERSARPSSRRRTRGPDTCERGRGRERGSPIDDEVLTGLWYARKAGGRIRLTCVSHRWVPSRLGNARKLTEQCGTTPRAGPDVRWSPPPWHRNVGLRAAQRDAVPRRRAGAHHRVRHRRIRIDLAASGGDAVGAKCRSRAAAYRNARFAHDGRGGQWTSRRKFARRADDRSWRAAKRGLRPERGRHLPPGCSGAITERPMSEVRPFWTLRFLGHESSGSSEGDRARTSYSSANWHSRCRISAGS